MMIKQGARVKTNAKFAEMIMDEVHLAKTLPWYGEVLKPFSRIPGCWGVKFDKIKYVQYIHELYLDVLTHRS